MDFLLMFSSPINSGTVEKPINKLYKFTTEFNQVLVFFLKDFLLSQNSTFLILAWAFPLHLYKLFPLHNPKELRLLILVIGLCLWVFCDLEKIFYCEVVEVAALSELVSSIVSVAAPWERTCESIEFKWELVTVDDLVRLVIVNILHSVEGGNVEQWLEFRNISSYLWLLILSLFTLLSLYLLAHLSCLLICKFFLCCDWYLLDC